jgi:hypothetical protein
VSKWVSGGIATPNILQGLTTVGTASKGVADAQVSFTPGQNISPFNESRIYIDNDSTFYQTGTDQSILPGFDQRLSSKVAISINLPYGSTTRVLKDDPNETAQKRMAYYSFATNQWEYIGKTAASALVDAGETKTALEEWSRGFSPSWGELSDLAQIGRLALPISNYGFPFHQKFHASDQFHFCLSSTLSTPFLLEKVIYEGFVGNNDTNGSDFKDGSVHSFFILRQHDSFLPTTTLITSGNTLNETYSITASIPSTLTITGTTSSTYVKTIREMVTYASIGFLKQDSNYDFLRNVFSSSCDLFLDNSGQDGDISYFPNSKIKLNFVPKSIPVHRAAWGQVGGDAGGGVLFSLGGRGRGMEGSGRPVIAPIPAAKKIEAYGFLQNTGIEIFATGSSFTQSPYVLLPKDKLIFGWNSANDILGGGDGAPGASLTLGSAKITLFGSLLRDNKYVSEESNQPLTSDVIHEDLHYDNPVFDQFDVEPYASLSGSYIDLIITGSMLATTIGDPTAANVRKVQGSVAAGQAGTTGSLQRFVNLTSESDLYYDSLAPSPVEIAFQNGFTAWNAGPTYTIDEGIVGGGQDNRADQKWLRSFPFSSEYANLNRTIEYAKPATRNFNGEIEGLPVRGVAELTFDSITGGFIRKLEIEPYKKPSDQNQYASGISMYRQFFGFGDGLGGRPILENLVLLFTHGAASEVYAGNLILRGFKYGLLNASRENSKSRFRRDRYGQYRDMLEQSPNAAFFVKNSIEYPVEIQFYSRPSKDGKGRLPLKNPAESHSQNLSSFATSSLPYFDGVARERTDNPDLTVEDVSI